MEAIKQKFDAKRILLLKSFQDSMQALKEEEKREIRQYETGIRFGNDIGNRVKSIGAAISDQQSKLKQDNLPKKTTTKTALPQIPLPKLSEIKPYISKNLINFHPKPTPREEKDRAEKILWC